MTKKKKTKKISKVKKEVPMRMSLKISDLEIVLTKLKSLKVDYVTIKHFVADDCSDPYCYLSFDFHNTEYVGICSGIGPNGRGEICIVYVDEIEEDGVDELLREERTIFQSPLKLF